jgi:hypothetical protein
VVKLNTKQLAQERARRSDLVRKYPTLQQFDHRVLVRWTPFQPPEPLKLEPGLAQAIDSFTGVPGTVDLEREQLIRDPAVVEDPQRTYEPCSGAGTPMGAWTFGRLITEMANQPVTGIDPADLAEHWLEQWKQDLPINGFVVPKRAVGAQRFLDLWPRLPNGKLDLAHAPLRLLAIVNRQDLRGNARYGGGDAGEARLVFGAVNCVAPTPSLPEVLPFTTIFEYGVPKSGCVNVRDWARQLRDANAAKLPKRSAINQVRSNEFALAACDACHTNETGTQFLHIKPRAIGATSQLSHFLTGVGMPMSTPVSGEMRTYNDLLARQAKLDATAHMSCSFKTDIALEELFIDTLGPFVSHEGSGLTSARAAPRTAAAGCRWAPAECLRSAARRRAAANRESASIRRPGCGALSGRWPRGGRGPATRP